MFNNNSLVYMVFLPIFLIIFIPFMKMNTFFFIFFLETLYWIMIMYFFIYFFMNPFLILGILSFSAIEGTTLFSLLMSFLSKMKMFDFYLIMLIMNSSFSKWKM